MKASTIISTVVSMAVVANAVPTADNVKVEARTDKSLGGAAQTCSSNQVVSCCNPTDKTTNTGLLAGLLSGSILGNSCVGIGASILNILSPNSASGVCGNSNSVKCCAGDKNTGLLVVDLDILTCSDIL
ncbi:hypothetical protein UCDDS831_g05550 [Diplodia seriata]|uniref:Hydrophobin n=1 Tax=Diplodia seriata TaxID=420778 RepID=A0A0G2GRC5_9PEZI|nr:hypothetical protein UCDDS831_g05550 [Diplodia seriata]